MSSWSLDWLKQRPNWDQEMAEKARQRKLGIHLVSMFRQAISANRLKPGDRLPSVRDLTQELGISRNTAAYIYEQLCTEGYTFSLIGSGTYVSAITPAMVHKAQIIQDDNKIDETSILLKDFKFSKSAKDILDHEYSNEVSWGAFMPGLPDVTEFPRPVYAKILNKLWRYAQPEMLTYGKNGGELKLKIALTEYLRVGRGIQCIPEQILITEGMHQAIEIIIRSLLNENECVWTEEPCYWGINKLLKINKSSIKIISKKVDSEGFVIDESQEKPKIIFTTPSHQYPLGYVMSLERRKSLLSYARSNNCFIVEDDYDSEFKFGDRQIPCMQGMEKKSPVIYLGTFSKTLFPALRVAYMVLPIEIVDLFSNIQSTIYRQGNQITQLALAEFINQGHYTKHIRRMRVIYSKRRQWLISLILKYLGKDYLLEVDGNAGLHLILRLPSHLNDVEICEKLKVEGIFCKPLSKYYFGSDKTNGLLLGYASMTEEKIQFYFFKMLQIIKNEIRKI